MSLEKSPYDVFFEEEQKQRASGRTTRLIMALPSLSRYMVIACSDKHAKYIKDEVKSLRDIDVANKGTFIGWDSAHEELQKFDGPVYVDHSVFFKMGENYINLVNKK